MRVALTLLLLLTACAETQTSNRMLEQDKRQYQDMVEKGARQLEQAEVRAEARKAKEAQEARDLKAYYDWYNALPYEQKMNETRWQEEQQRMKQDREDRMLEQAENRRARLEAAEAQERAAALQALGMINQGRGVLGPGYTPPPAHHYDFSVPTYQPSMQRRHPTNCTSNVVGSQVYTNCY